MMAQRRHASDEIIRRNVEWYQVPNRRTQSDAEVVVVFKFEWIFSLLQLAHLKMMVRNRVPSPGTNKTQAHVARSCAQCYIANNTQVFAILHIAGWRRPRETHCKSKADVAAIYSDKRMASPQSVGKSMSF